MINVRADSEPIVPKPTTPLDEFVPVGEPIHPYDFYELLLPVKLANVIEVVRSPKPLDAQDYARNSPIGKTGVQYRVERKEYWVTVAVPWKTKMFEDAPKRKP